MIKMRDWRLMKPVVEKLYQERGLERTLEYCVISGINLMASLHIIIKVNPDDELACEKLDYMLKWYKEEIVEDLS